MPDDRHEVHVAVRQAHDQLAAHEPEVVNVAGNAASDRCLKSLAEQRIDGLLVFHTVGDEDWLKELVQRREAVAAVDCLDPLPELDAVVFDHRAAIELAIDHLLELGHRRIGYLGTCYSRAVPHNEVRERAFVEEMRRRGLPLEPRDVFGVAWVEGDDSLQRDAGRLGAEHFMAMGDERPTALIAYDNLIAASAIRTLGESGQRVPQDMSIVNFEDTPLSRHLIPRLTSLAHPLEEMGCRAAQMLIERARAPRRTGGAKDEGGRHESFLPELIARESSAAPSR